MAYDNRVARIFTYTYRRNSVSVPKNELVNEAKNRKSFSNDMHNTKE